MVEIRQTKRPGPAGQAGKGRGAGRARKSGASSARERLLARAGAPSGGRGRGKGSGGGRRSPLLPIAVIIAVLVVGHLVTDALTGLRQPVTLLLLGVDADRTRTDVVLLAHVDPVRQEAALLSVPRDSLVEIPCGKLMDGCRTPDKLAHAHAYGSKRGPEVTVEVVEALLGVRIDGYVKVDFAGFEQAVDALGGVEVTIEQPMHYEDPTADPPLAIHFEPGVHRLDGEAALRYVRFRSDGRGDVGRTERTRTFLLALLAAVRERWSAEQAVELVRAVAPHVRTNVSAGRLAALARLAFDLEPDRVRTAMVPGQPVLHPNRGWVWEVDREEARHLAASLLNP